MILSQAEIDYHIEQGYKFAAFEWHQTGKEKSKYMPPAQYRGIYGEFNFMKGMLMAEIRSIKEDLFIRFKPTSETIERTIQNPHYSAMTMMKLDFAYKGRIFSSRDISNNEIALWTFNEFKRFCLGIIIEAMNDGALDEIDKIRNREEEAEKAYEMAY